MFTSFFLCSAAAGCVSTAKKSEPCCSEQDSTKGLHITFVSGSASTQRHTEIGLNDQIWEKQIHECPLQKCWHFVSCHAVDNVLLTSPSHWKRLFTAVLFAASPSIEIHFKPRNDRLNRDMPRISDLYMIDMMVESLSSNSFFNISSILPSSEPNQLQQKINAWNHRPILESIDLLSCNKIIRHFEDVVLCPQSPARSVGWHRKPRRLWGWHVIPPPKPNMTIEKQPHENVSPIKKGWFSIVMFVCWRVTLDMTSNEMSLGEHTQGGPHKATSPWPERLRSFPAEPQEVLSPKRCQLVSGQRNPRTTNIGSNELFLDCEPKKGYGRKRWI